jgi:hypothetical protein
MHPCHAYMLTLARLVCRRLWLWPQHAAAAPGWGHGRAAQSCVHPHLNGRGKAGCSVGRREACHPKQLVSPCFAPGRTGAFECSMPLLDLLQGSGRQCRVTHPDPQALLRSSRPSHIKQTSCAPSSVALAPSLAALCSRECIHAPPSLALHLPATSERPAEHKYQPIFTECAERRCWHASPVPLLSFRRWRSTVA